MSNNLTTVFISHANPEDNYFAAWLASKLTLMGYETWCDTRELTGGEDFWKNIDRKIRNDSIKFLFLASKTSIEKEGPLKELAIADKIKNRGDFIIPIRIDEVPYGDLPPEIIRLNTLDCSRNWAEGVTQLSKKLHEEAVTKSGRPGTQGILPFWYTALTVEGLRPVPRPERYLSNWFEIRLPARLYAHLPHGIHRCRCSDMPYPIFRDKDRLLSFASQDSLQEYIPIARTEQIDAQSFVAQREWHAAGMHYVIWDTRRKAVRLLNQAFSKFLLARGLREYPMSGRRSAFYFPADYPGPIATLKKFGRGSTALFGTRRGFQWHFAIEGAAFLKPVAAYSVTYHVVFTDQGKPVASKARQHSLRRSLGKDWYNRQWRDKLLAAMLSVAGEQDGAFEIPVCRHQSVRVEASPLTFDSPVGYVEPTKESRDER